MKKPNKTPRDIIGGTSPDDIDKDELLKILSSDSVASPLKGTLIQGSLIAFANHLSKKRDFDTMITTVLMAYDVIIRNSIAKALVDNGYPVDGDSLSEHSKKAMSDVSEMARKILEDSVGVVQNQAPVPLPKAPVELKPSQFSAMLKYAQEKFASTDEERKALDNVLARVAVLENGGSGRRNAKGAKK